MNSLNASKPLPSIDGRSSEAHWLSLLDRCGSRLDHHLYDLRGFPNHASAGQVLVAKKCDNLMCDHLSSTAPWIHLLGKILMRNGEE